MASPSAAQSLRVNYRAQVSSSGTTTPVATPRTVVPLSQSAATLTGKIRHSLKNYLSQADLSGPAGTRAKTAGGAR